MSDRPHPVPRLTGTPPISGRFKVAPEDFRVDEIAAFDPDGAGEHCHVRLRKRDLTTKRAVELLCRALGADPRQAGWAGMKDRHAVTTQWVSVFGVSPEDARGAEVEGLEVLEAHAHGRKRKPGQLRGNRFELVVRDVPEDALPALREALETLVARGAPNAFGAQRFGRDGDNVAKARAWLVEGGRPPRGRFEKRLYVSALQSDAFNRALAERLEEGSFDRPIDGDLFRKEDTGGLFVSDDLARATERCAAWEISPTGPMFGRKMRAPEGEAGAREARLREALGLDDAVLARFGKLGLGTRRPYRVRVADAELAPAEGGVRLAFALPSGAYATVVLGELFKGGLVDASRAGS
ncbi:MAG TPA: tRNA pseudouridine(13) synthase TruD [Polyangiaceae bacterium LLY-WYZ-15_(1-7)]|nr:tRNA pseudouridine(13) synthase TruD [Myxococcales bacterium]MAT28188.1 tRNA pseudouridine(13) synthase TruD [Sandaracinus sp.]HJK94465.1 tRNA pseudouridine(13) synthase TruD [Polyangiaceae bacterium LLY-WYZ-15_(1-7)]MBJ70945.1 tRNA pseudouridine(13) synthase TruD [Sandaracinus sp.]HJL04542.1 tRNA pseudouridine(13) synthase TruD [Polyangiaceae bacterium LLY-WYZ-15_(1-7)]